MTAADRCAFLVVTCGGLGCARVAPGTVASLAFAGVTGALEFAGYASIWLFVGVTLAASIACIALGGWCERHFGGKDPGAVVIDEIAGMALALCVPLRATSPYFALVLAFALFRFFDIVKPLGISRLQRLPRGWGILVDDLAAGACAAAVIQCGAWFWSR
ncbi:MAG: phosphatidylglycerophosphatase A [Planctomycetota bacterium]